MVSHSTVLMAVSVPNGQPNHFRFRARACPPGPEAETGAGGPALIEQFMWAPAFREPVLYAHILQARYGPGVSTA